jgi:hypothetical protein
MKTDEQKHDEHIGVMTNIRDEVDNIQDSGKRIDQSLQWMTLFLGIILVILIVSLVFMFGIAQHLGELVETFQAREQFLNVNVENVCPTSTTLPRENMTTIDCWKPSVEYVKVKI